jgi:hypothetical protein
MFVLGVGQRSVKFPRGGVELFEEGDIHRRMSAVVPTGEAPTGCAEAHQLSSLLHFARDDHNNWLLLAGTVFAAHMLAKPLRLHVFFPGHR